MRHLPASAQRVAEAAKALNLSIEIKEMPESTRTAEEAALACGCIVAQIVKSLLFRGATSGKPVLLLVSGKNRVNEKAVAADLGEALTRPDAAFVREITGFAIGGVPPFAHATPMATYMDRDLLAYDRVFAAAGTPRTIFSATPAALQTATGATLIDVTGK